MDLITWDSISKHKGMKNLEKREVRSHNKVRALFAENKVRFARAEQLHGVDFLGYLAQPV